MKVGDKVIVITHRFDGHQRIQRGLIGRVTAREEPHHDRGLNCRVNIIKDWNPQTRLDFGIMDYNDNDLQVIG